MPNPTPLHTGPLLLSLPHLTLQGVRIVLSPSKPKLTVLSTSPVCGDGTTSSSCSGQFLMTALHNLYEIDSNGNKVNGRDAGDVLNLSQVGGPEKREGDVPPNACGASACGAGIAPADACAHVPLLVPPHPAGHLGAGE